MRDRIKEIVKMKGRDLQDHAGNWRGHPMAQEYVMRDILREVGSVDVLLAYRSERNGGALTLLDGHLRKKLDPEEEWNVAISDLTDDEADYVLATHDPVTGMAEADARKLEELLGRVSTDSVEVSELLKQLGNSLDGELEGLGEDEVGVGGETGPQDMELLPFEHYDIVLMVFKKHLDWLQAMSVLKLERMGDPRVRREEVKNKKIGLCRVIDGSELVKRLVKAEGLSMGEVHDLQQDPGKEPPAAEMP